MIGYGIFVVSLAILAFYILLHLSYLALLLCSLYGIRVQPRRVQAMDREKQLDSSVVPPVSLIVPAYNEEASIVESVQALLGLKYPHLEVIVVNDGSKDGTLAQLTASFSLRRSDLVYHKVISTQSVQGVYLSTLHPNLVVADKVNGGKSDAINAGLNLCRTPWVCVVDADSLLEEDALLRVMQPVLEDDTVVASSGIIRIANGCRIAGGRVLKVGLPRAILPRFQIIEYLHGFLQGRIGWSWLNALLIISGAFGVFRTETLRAIAGYSTTTVGEDMEVVVRIHAHFRKRRQQPYRILFVMDPVCWTEVPSTVRALRNQRRRWQRGLMEVLSRHRNLLFRRGSGMVGYAAMPVFALEAWTPVVELLGYVFMPIAWGTGFISTELLIFYLVLAFLIGMFYSVSAVFLEDLTYRRYSSLSDLLQLFAFALFENLGFHQMILWFRLEGIYEWLRGKRHWGEQTRSGFIRRMAPGA